MTKQAKGFSAVAGVIIVIVIGLGVAVWYYFSDQSAEVKISPEADSVAEANNWFAIDLYDQLKAKEGNIFFSPYSISTALAMTYEGARGETADEIREVFHYPNNQNEMRSGFSGLNAEINKTDKKYELSTANALWAQLDYKFLDDYFDVVEQYYGGEVTNLDISNDTENSRLTINKWVEDQTNEKIVNLIPEGKLAKLTRLVLTSAIYFKGDWVTQFEEDQTKDKDFRITPNNTVQVPTMKRQDKEAVFNYMENDQLQILGMPYSGEELSMLIILPKEDDISGLENSLTHDQLIEWKSQLTRRRVDIYIPKFKFEDKYFMVDTLSNMGMPTAFLEDSADFSGMNGMKSMWIGNVIHQSFVEVNEKGTEAAAATAVGMETSIGERLNKPIIPVFRADHPFIFTIQHNDTGNILFMGRVSDPR